MATNKNKTKHTNDKPCRHHQTKGLYHLEGMAYYDLETLSVSFSPNDPTPNELTPYRHEGVGMQMRDGSFEFIPRKRARYNSTLIKKLTHGRLSLTKQGFYQLTLKFSLIEKIDISAQIVTEAIDASDALSKVQWD